MSTDVEYWRSIALTQEKVIKTLNARIVELEEEDKGSHQLIRRLSDLLTGVVNAAKGTPPPSTLWSFHDAPEVVQALKDENEKLKEQLKFTELDELLAAFDITDDWRIEAVKDAAMNRHNIRATHRPYYKKVLDEAFQLLKEVRSE